MKGDISADFHEATRRYSGVRAQAGRVLTDADFNAAFDVIDDRLETLVRTLLCAAGSPDNGLALTAAAPVTVPLPGGGLVQSFEVTLAPGTFVLGGRASVLGTAIASLAQGDWLSQMLDPDDLPPAPAAGRTDLVWLEQVEGGVHAVEDREIQERALGSADTTTRLRPRLRVRVLDDVPPECDLAAEALEATLREGGHGISADGSEILSAARLGVAFTDAGPSLDPCAPAAAAGYLGAENHTLKVMLTAPDRFVWAYDHGEPLYRVQIDATAGEVIFLTEPRDTALYPLPGQVIEILPWEVLLPNREKVAARLGHLAVLTGHYDPPTRRVAYDGSLPPAWQDWLNGLPAATLGEDDDPPRFFFARIWQPPVAGVGPAQATGTDIALSETGLALHFADAGIPGDYWTVALRPDAPELIQPWALKIDPAAGEVPGAPPIGPRRFHAPLGLVTWPNPIGPAPALHDCRNRFRRLCRIKGCCTYQVGDGHTSFGDFNTIQEAVAALPPEGGEICLLPGLHEGRVDLAGRHDIKISGCGPRSRVTIVADPAAPGRPGFRLDGARHIRFSDFAVAAAGGPVFGALDPCADIDLLRLRIRAGDNAAIALAVSALVSVADCDITAAPLAQALTHATIAGLMPLIFLAGEDLTLERNRIAADFPEQNRNRVALGGVQIGGDSRRVRIEDNLIEGGNGNGITLGSLLPPERPDDGQGGGVIFIPPWIVIDDDGCVKFIPGGTIVFPGERPETAPRSAGPVTGLRIRDNTIQDHGGSGISVAHWFIATGREPVDTLDDIEIDEAEIDDNRIHRCFLVGLAAALPVEAAFNSGFGGIALAAVSDTAIHHNEIRACGGTGRSPICGIYIRFAERLRIADNRISDNGRAASLTDPLLVGNIGGIVIGHADGAEQEPGERVREVPAAVITHNRVVAPEGRALELAGSGAMLVQSNTLTSHGNNVGGVILMLLVALLQNNAGVGSKLTSQDVEGQYRAANAQIGGSAVLILNTGVNPNLARIASASAFLGGKAKADGGHEIVTDAGRPGLTLGKATRAELGRQPLLGMKGLVNPAAVRTQPGGVVSFADNVVTFDARSRALTFSLASVAIISLDDVGLHDNHCAVDLSADLVLIDALVLGLGSVRVIGNRFRETLIPYRDPDDSGLQPTRFSAVTFGILNATEMNQGTYCFLTIGAKKPRVRVRTVGDAVQATLDTNRHMISDALCERFRSISEKMGTD